MKDLRSQWSRIALHLMKMKLVLPFTTSFGTTRERVFYLVELIDRDGLSGWGESVAMEEPWYNEETVQTNGHLIRDFLAPLLVSGPVTHPDEVDGRFAGIRRNCMAKSALEGAVWDWYAKRSNVSLASLLGGRKHEIDVGVSIGIQPSIDALLAVIQARMQHGYKRIKVKIKPGWDLDVLDAVRARYPDLPLMADANSAYSLDDLDHLLQLDRFGLTMVEQPLAHDDIIDHATLQKVLHTPVCLDESIHCLDDVRKALDLGSCRVINIKTGRVGGLTEAKRIHDYCLARGVPVWCGGMLESGIGRAHNIALTSLPGFTLPGDTAASANYWSEDIIEPEVSVRQGTVSVPQTPGLGFRIATETLKKYRLSLEVLKL